MARCNVPLIHVGSDDDDALSAGRTCVRERVIAQEVWREKEDEPRNHGASNLTLLAGTPDEKSQERMVRWDKEYS